ncbi:MAG: EamA family transporter [Pirellulaceae bacterium]
MNPPTASYNKLGLGIAAGIGAAIFYTGANISLRYSSTNISPVVVAFFKALITWVCCSPVYFWGFRRYTTPLPSRRGSLILLGASVFVQLVGSNGFQLSLGLLGVALAVPIVIGSMVVLGIVLGRIFLGEPIEAVSAISLLVVSIFLMSIRAEASHIHMEAEQLILPATWSAAFGIVAAIMTGLTYAVLGVSIRRALLEPVHPFTAIMFVTTTGILLLGPLAFVQTGFSDLASFRTTQWWALIFGGLFNAAGFICLSFALRNLNVLYVNAINVSQVGLAAIAGMMLFGEPTTTYFTIGLGVMLAGFILLGVIQNRKRIRRKKLEPK